MYYKTLTSNTVRLEEEVYFEYVSRLKNNKTLEASQLFGNNYTKYYRAPSTFKRS